MTPKKNYNTSEIKLKKFDPIAVSSKIGICGDPFRLDACSTCPYGCIYCKSINRSILAHGDEFKMGETFEQLANRVFDSPMSPISPKFQYRGPSSR